MQIIILFLLDIPYLFIVIKMKEYFRSVILFIVVTLYMLGFSMFNFYFLL